MTNQSSVKPTHAGVLTINGRSLSIKFALFQTGDSLRRYGIEDVEDVGRPFDPCWHEAIFVRNDPCQPDQMILEVVQHGYCLGDKVFSQAKVIVNDLSYFPGGRHAR